MSRRFGILTFAVAPFATIRQEWRWADELGFDHAWVPDTWSMEGFFDFEPWTRLAALAQATSHLQIGTLVTTIIARPPTLVAAEALTVDQHLRRRDRGLVLALKERDRNHALRAALIVGEAGADLRHLLVKPVALLAALHDPGAGFEFLHRLAVCPFLA